MYSREDHIRQVREIGESLIKNAESIIGFEEYLNGDVHIHAELNLHDIPTINISRSFLPEKFVADNRVEVVNKIDRSVS